MSIEEGVEFLRPTGYPVTDKQLGHWLSARGAKRERVDRKDYYLVADVLEVHCAHVDKITARGR